MGYADNNQKLTGAERNGNGEASESQRATLSNFSNDLTFLLGIEGDRYRFITVNNAFLYSSRLRREQVDGRFADEVVPPDLYPPVLEKFNQAVWERRTIQWEDVSDYPDGYRTSIISITPVFNEYDNCILLAGTFHDITERKKREEIIAAREKQLDMIYNTLSDAIFLISVENDERLRFTSVNNAFLHAIGLTTEQVEGKFVEEMVTECYLPQLLPNCRKVIEQRLMVQWEENSVCPSGNKTGIVSITPVFNQLGNCTTLVGAVHDISERRKVQQEKDHAIEQLVKQRDLSEKIIETLPGLFFIINKEGQVLRWNKSKAMVDGFICDEVIGKKILDFIPSGEHSMVLKNILKCYETGSNEAEIHIRTKENEWMLFYCNGVTIEYKGDTCIMGVGVDITDKRKATDQLQREKELCDAIINSLPGIFYLFDNEGNFLRGNKNLEIVSGYNAEELQQHAPGDFFLEKDKAFIEEKIQKIFSGNCAEVETDLLTRDGKTILYFFNGTNIDYEGRPCLMGVGIDISVRKQIENELVEAESKFRTLVEKAQIGVYIIQKDRFVYVNPRFAEVFGYQPEELIGLSAMDTIIPDEFKPMVNDYVIARKENKIELAHYEVPAIRKDGTLNRVEFFGGKTLFKGASAIIGTMADITERKLAEEALQRSEANLQAIFNATDNIYVLLNRHFQIQSCNLKGEYFFRNELKQEVQRNANVLGYFSEERRPELQDRMLKVLQGQYINYESPYLQEDGSYHWYFVRMFPIVNEGKKFFGLMIALSDITDKKRMQKEILTQKVQEQKKITRAILKAQEKERNKIGQELHDNVNQILVGAKICLGLTNGLDESSDELVKKSIEYIDNAVDEIRFLTSEQITPEKKVDLQELIQSLLYRMNELSPVKGHFVCNIGGVMLKDSLKLNVYRIIQEALNNIIKHSNAANAYIQLKADKKGLHVMISDDGKGFDVKQKFKGIGITNITNRVESFNGEIQMESGNTGSIINLHFCFDN